MPYYEYLCDEGHEFEVQQRITEDPLTKCEHRTTLSVEDTHDGPNKSTGVRVRQRVCNAPCHRLISDTSFKFKGGSPTPKYHT
jgi:putative FmdB family regulatory protein